MPRVPRSFLHAGLVTVGVMCSALAGGCGSSKPQAPALRDEPVYKNATIGLEFLAPEGWAVKAKADVPAGPLAKERLLVRYDRMAGDGSAAFELTIADLPPATDLAAHVARASFGATEWKPAAKPEKGEISGVPSTRFSFTGQVGAQKLTKEVVAVRRGERVFFFTALFKTGDTKTRDQIRRAVDSARWKG